MRIINPIGKASANRTIFKGVIGNIRQSDKNFKQKHLYGLYRSGIFNS